MQMNWLETKIPPPLVVAILCVVSIALARLLPGLSFALPLGSIAAGAVVLAGLALNILPKRSFRRAKTTVNPLRPDLASSLVTSGIYRYSRNPMYLGYSLVLMGWALYLHNVASLSTVPGFMLYVTRFQIQPEERHLSARFPEEYAALRKRVPRWL